jgi:cephalosporin hydroxylase
VLGSEAVTNILHALATGFLDRAVNVVVMSDEINEDERAILWRALAEDQNRSEQARRFGDAMRALGAERQFVNECYRVAFYAGDDWKALSTNPLYAFFTANRSGYPLDKWIHYFSIYDRHLSRYRGLPVRVLEIGVYRGGGLEMLRHYLGPDAKLVGVDIDEVARAAARGYEVEIGDQADPAFLQRVVEKHGPFDIVIDDGGHTMNQQIVSVETLFPLLQVGGTYLVEDCHTSYWPEYADQGPDGQTFIEWVKTRLDDLNAYHYSRSEHLVSPWQTCVDGLHVYDSVVVLTKTRHTAPFSELSGNSEFINYPRQTGAIHLEMLATRDAAISQAAALAAQTVDIRAQADAEAERSRTDLGRLREENEQIRSDLLGSREIIREMRRSRSWKLTAPIRRLKSLISRQ